MSDERKQLKHEVYMRMAQQLARLSTCRRLSVGAVLLRRDSSVAGVGYNGALPGQPHCVPETCNPMARCFNTRHAERVYQSGLRRGIPKEVARLPIPVGRYSRMRASVNLRNWLAFLTLRSDHVPSGRAAQWEVRQFANAVGDLIAGAFPRSWALFAQQ